MVTIEACIDALRVRDEVPEILNRRRTKGER
jgi:hypothetical protein